LDTFRGVLHGPNRELIGFLSDQDVQKWTFLGGLGFGNSALKKTQALFSLLCKSLPLAMDLGGWVGGSFSGGWIFQGLFQGWTASPNIMNTNDPYPENWGYPGYPGYPFV
jgi:hypothetical protein